jgi:glycine/D-amino acid oxidase-like deaminating enzyme
MNTPLKSPAKPMRIVILGGGFAGLYSALHFEKTHRRRSNDRGDSREP